MYMNFDKVRKEHSLYLGDIFAQLISMISIETNDRWSSSRVIRIRVRVRHTQIIHAIVLKVDVRKNMLGLTLTLD